MLFPYNCVMLIDDSDTDNLVAEIMIRNSGLAKQTITYTKTSQALKFLAEYQGKKTEPAAGFPDLILLDIHLPVLDGFDFLNGLTTMSFSVLPPVYVLTASLHPNDRLRAGTYNCVKGFILKPLTQELLRRLRKP